MPSTSWQVNENLENKNISMNNITQIQIDSDLSSKKTKKTSYFIISFLI